MHRLHDVGRMDRAVVPVGLGHCIQLGEYCEYGAFSVLRFAAAVNACASRSPQLDRINRQNAKCSTEAPNGPVRWTRRVLRVLASVPGV